MAHQLRGSFGGDLIKDRKSNGTILPLQPSVPNEPCLYQLFRSSIDRLCYFACTKVVGFNYLLLIYESRLVICSCSDLTAAATGLAQ
ncbi:hypothetical protein T11_11784 [Trichinella zimbabwensis]|uniref:Uncharacterized protein n=1 Tax=Trichinella zimbabwensis TaxID=268475 RepID=A0A0V1HIT2_9BILA|nr:hypothetical protein T11_11784 [Trichinella zimbabwensis]